MSHRKFGWYVVRFVALGSMAFGLILGSAELYFFLTSPHGSYEMHKLHLLGALSGLSFGGMLYQMQSFAAVIGVFKDVFAAIRPALGNIQIGGRRSSDPKPGSPEAEAIAKADKLLPPIDDKDP